MRLAEAKSEVDAGKVREALAAVLASANFCNSPQLSAFLSYVVEKTLAGKGSGLKAYAIATEALGRPPSFDPITDAAVRVLAGRVRSALEIYYLRNGNGENIVIELLPGSYTPQFRGPSPPAVPPPRSPAGGQGVIVRPSEFNTGRGQGFAVSRDTAQRLLILDDDPEIRPILHRIGEDLGFMVVDTAFVNEFWLAYKALKPTHIILDLVLPGADGLEIMRELGRQSAKCRITLLSGVDSRLLRTAERLGREFGLDITAAISKPFDIEDVERAIAVSHASAIDASAGELADAIESSQIVLHFQPKIAWSPDGESRLDGMEALARWNHPSRGLIFPDSFIVLAEGNGLIVPLTHRVIDLAIHQLTKLQADFPTITMAVNLSAALLDDPLLPDLIAGKLDAAGIERNRLVLEITESIAANEMSGAIDAMARLRLKDFTLSIDDFGTGHSSLLRLLQMPFNELKIDKHFVLESVKNEDARLIVRTVIDLARSLGIRACAEGVETEECLRVLRSLGCNCAQGYLFSKPVPAAELSGVLTQVGGARW